MEAKMLVYHISVITTALGMFLPLLYGAVGPVREVLGSNPLLKSLAIIILGWIIAYITFEEKEESRENTFTAS